MATWKQRYVVHGGIRFAMYLFIILLFCKVGRADTIEPVQPAVASSPFNTWQLDAQFYVTGSAHYQEIGGNAVAYESLANTARFNFWSAARPYSASLFIDYRFVTANRDSDAISLGGSAKYRFSRWDATGYIFASKTPATTGNWFYAGRLRFRLAEKHKIGLEAVGAFKSARTPKVMLGYFGTVSDSFSVNAFAGSRTSAGMDLSARAELVWRVR